MKNQALYAQYVELLKTSLLDWHHTNCDAAHNMPIEWIVVRKTPKKILYGVLSALVSLAGLKLVKPDRKSIEQRRKLRESGLDWPPFAKTMVGRKRLDNIQMIVETLVQDKIAGDVIETGVWRGGASIFTRLMLNINGAQDKVLYACDSFEGLPPPDAKTYPADEGDQHHTFKMLAVSQDEVAENFRLFGALGENVKFIEGFFEQSLVTPPCEKFSLLRLDGDMYSSTIQALEPLYPRLEKGGFIIIDDYALPACRLAVEDYRKAHTINEPIVDIDGVGAYWRKS